MLFLKKQVIDALRTVEDPDLKQDLVTLGMIQDLGVNQKQVTFTLVLTTPACPLQEILKKACIEAIYAKVAADLEITIQLDTQVTSTRTHDPVLPQVKNIIAIASGKGGVGKSTVAVNVAVALAKCGAQVGLLDADIFGPSIPTMLGCEQEKPQVMHQAGKNYLVPLEKHGIKLLSMGLLAPADEAMVWRGPMASKALRQLLGDTFWGVLDYLLIDLPPGTSDIHLTLVQAVPVTGAVIVTTPQKIALVDATKALEMFQKQGIDVPILGVVENMAYFTAPELPNSKYYLFGQEGGKEFAAQHKLPFLGQIPLVQRIREGGDAGIPVVLQENAGAFDNIAAALAQQVAIRNARLAPTQTVERTR
ncbi:MAG TPA: MRP family ATP-binding protein [Amoebophilaceae bacterium]|nr:MRP family ATP-binding protein [Amoebophilaceae bacterium]